MFRKTFKYQDFNGVTREETKLFNLTEAEMMQLTMKYPAGVDVYIKDIMERKDSVAMAKFFTEFIDLTYGEKSADGYTFVKTPELLARFKATQAYSDLFMSFFTEPNAIPEFVYGVMPAKIQAELKKNEAEVAASAPVFAPTLV